MRGRFTKIFDVVGQPCRVEGAMKRSIPFTALLVALLSLVDGDAFGGPSEAQRYPFDPACAWGRLSDGRGLFVRCLSKDEAERLSKPVAPNSVPSVQSAKPTPTSVPAPSSSAAANSATVSTAPPPAAGATAGTEAGELITREPLSAELVGVVADEGELPLAKRKLAVPHERYAQCVMDHGGLKAPSAHVEVRFLVRERGRAEGAAAEKFQGMSEAAASCIAQVVDRRQTGTGAGPVVAATATIRVRKAAAK